VFRETKDFFLLVGLIWPPILDTSTIWYKSYKIIPSSQVTIIVSYLEMTPNVTKIYKYEPQIWIQGQFVVEPTNKSLVFKLWKFYLIFEWYFFVNKINISHVSSVTFLCFIRQLVSFPCFIDKALQFCMARDDFYKYEQF
jgi:hypothetical protein